MTTAADDSAVEDAFEALLAGRPAPEGAAGLTAFTEAVRTSATRPGRPNAALAELLATGLITDLSSPSVRTARTAGSPPERRPSRVRIRRRTAMIFPVLLAKFLSAGAVAQAATGAGIVVVAVTGAGAVGVLPTPVQDTVAGVLETVTPLDLPSSDDEVLPEEVPTTEPVTEEVVDPTAPVEAAGEELAVFSAETWAAEGPADYASFGAWVSEGARSKAFKDGDLKFSEVVRAWAHRKGLAEDELAAELESEGVELEEPADGTTDAAPDAEVQRDTADAEVATTDGDRKQGGGKGSAQGGGKAEGKSKGNGRN